MNLDNMFGSAGHKDGKPIDYVIFDRDNISRRPFINRPTKGKTKRKRFTPANGKKTNVGDPMLNQSIGKSGRR